MDGERRLRLGNVKCGEEACGKRGLRRRIRHLMLSTSRCDVGSVGFRLKSRFRNYTRSQISWANASVDAGIEPRSLVVVARKT